MSPPSPSETNGKHTLTEITNRPTCSINTADMTTRTDRGMTTDRTDEIPMTAITHRYNPIDNDMNMTEGITTATEIFHTPTETTNLPMNSSIQDGLRIITTDETTIPDVTTDMTLTIAKSFTMNTDRQTGDHATTTTDRDVTITTEIKFV